MFVKFFPEFVLYTSSLLYVINHDHTQSPIIGSSTIAVICELLIYYVHGCNRWKILKFLGSKIFNSVLCPRICMIKLNELFVGNIGCKIQPIKETNLFGFLLFFQNRHLLISLEVNVQFLYVVFSKM